MPDPTLIIDDDATFNAILIRTLERQGHKAHGATNTISALALAREIVPAHVVLDLNMNGSSGLLLIPQLLAINPDCRIVVLTGYASIATAVDAIKLGAVQYLAKPVERFCPSLCHAAPSRPSWPPSKAMTSQTPT